MPVQACTLRVPPWTSLDICVFAHWLHFQCYNLLCSLANCIRDNAHLRLSLIDVVPSLFLFSSMLGSGQFGEVYKAAVFGLSRKEESANVAVKVSEGAPKKVSVLDQLPRLPLQCDVVKNNWFGVNNCDCLASGAYPECLALLCALQGCTCTRVDVLRQIKSSLYDIAGVT